MAEQVAASDARWHHECEQCGEEWAAPPEVDQEGRHVDPHGQRCDGPIKATPVVSAGPTHLVVVAFKTDNPTADHMNVLSLLSDHKDFPLTFTTIELEDLTPDVVQHLAALSVEV